MAKRQKFSEVFRERIDDITREAMAHGSSLTEICRRCEISRATPERHLKEIPRTIKIIDEMEDALDVIKQENKLKS